MPGGPMLPANHTRNLRGNGNIFSADESTDARIPQLHCEGISTNVPVMEHGWFSATVPTAVLRKLNCKAGIRSLRF